GNILTKIKARLAPAFGPLDEFSVLINEKNDFGFYTNTKGIRTLYPIKGIRYWMIRTLFRKEIDRRIMTGQDKDLTVLELGCYMGYIRHFIGDIPSVKNWIGIDWNPSFEEGALKAGYHRFIASDLDQKIPLESSSVDIIIFSHVLEHLPRPEFTMGEVARVLKPGGLLVASSPIVPRPLSLLWDRKLKKRLETGKVPKGSHMNAMSVPRWKRLLVGSGLRLEFLTGAYLLRWQASPLENLSLWFRLNMIWGALFPALGNEVHLTARKKS
ncbi:MAG: class I SAM-dependent methyltransferase, partial [Deltaproteobacteria bacterium]|nr:class I SAM-dependent methyltransferase [Deltaproteobacteria bacterium]